MMNFWTYDLIEVNPMVDYMKYQGRSANKKHWEMIMDILGYVLLGLMVVAVIYGIMVYNGLVRARQMSHEAWSGIEVQLKKRSNLIPNLVKTVKAYAAHESETLENVIKMRNQTGHVEKGDVQGRAQAEGLLGQAIGKIIALGEAYPDLKANENFIELQNALRDTEQEIQMARRYYNGAVRDLNVRIESFPSNIIANQFKFMPLSYFELEDEGDRAVPNLSF